MPPRPKKQSEKTASNMLTQDHLKNHFNYNPETGIFIRIKAVRSDRVGKEIGYICKVDGYVRIFFENKVYLAHRLAWLYMTGKWPTKQIDHIDRDRTNNKWCNLRDLNSQDNNLNKGISKRNTSGYTGISFNNKKKKWAAKKIRNGVLYFIGEFKTLDEAIVAYNGRMI